MLPCDSRLNSMIARSRTLSASKANAHINFTPRRYKLNNELKIYTGNRWKNSDAETFFKLFILGNAHRDSRMSNFMDVEETFLDNFLPLLYPYDATKLLTTLTHNRKSTTQLSRFNRLLNFFFKKTSNYYTIIDNFLFFPPLERPQRQDWWRSCRRDEWQWQ